MKFSLAEDDYSFAYVTTAITRGHEQLLTGTFLAFLNRSPDLEPEDTQSGRDYLIVENRCLARAIGEAISSRTREKIGDKGRVQESASRDGESAGFGGGAISVIKNESACRQFR